MKHTNILFTNSAVAFFFLFFIHGTSIENGQQGISYNVRGLKKFKNEKLNVDNLNKKQLLNRKIKPKFTDKTFHF